MPVLVGLHQGFQASKARGLAERKDAREEEESNLRMELAQNADQRAKDAALAADEERKRRQAAEDAAKGMEWWGVMSESQPDHRFEVAPGSMEVFERGQPWGSLQPNQNITAYTRLRDGTISLEISEDVPGTTPASSQRMITRNISMRPDLIQLHDEYKLHQGTPYVVTTDQDGVLVSVRTLDGYKVDDPIKTFGPDWLLPRAAQVKQREMEQTDRRLALAEQELNQGARKLALEEANQPDPNAKHNWDYGLNAKQRMEIFNTEEDRIWAWLVSARKLLIVEPVEGQRGAPVQYERDAYFDAASDDMNTWRHCVNDLKWSPSAASDYIRRGVMAILRGKGKSKEEVDAAAQRNTPGRKPPTPIALQEPAGMDLNGNTPATNSRYFQLPTEGRNEVDNVTRQAAAGSITRDEAHRKVREIFERYEIK